MEPTHDNRNLRGTESGRQVHGAWELIRLDPHQPDHAGSCLLEFANDLRNRNDSIGFVVGLHGDRHVVSQNPTSGAVQGQAVHQGKSVGGNDRTIPLDDIPRVIITGGLDQDDGERFWCGHSDLKTLG